MGGVLNIIQQFPLPALKEWEREEEIEGNFVR